MSGIPIITSLRDVAARYPLWLCDIWGVLHNGETAYLEAAAALSQFRGTGGTVVLITNAPRPRADVIAQLTELGVPAGTFDAIITSGDVTRALIAAEAGRKLHHLGPKRDLTLYDGLDVQLTALDEAEVVVCTGLIDDATETPGTYDSQLRAMHLKSVRMICANPDIVVERGASICYCAGAIGLAYEKLGGHVAYAGKPKPPIYEAALHAAAQLGIHVPRSGVLAIGDGVKTDIAGAHDFGVDSLFVASAIHVAGPLSDEPAVLAKLFAAGGPRPIAAIDRLLW